MFDGAQQCSRRAPETPAIRPCHVHYGSEYRGGTRAPAVVGLQRDRAARPHYDDIGAGTSGGPNLLASLDIVRITNRHAAESGQISTVRHCLFLHYPRRGVNVPPYPRRLPRNRGRSAS